MEDNQSDSYDEARLDALRKELHVSKSELLQLAYNEQQLNDKIDHLNAQGCHSINQQLFYEAMVYLEEAEKILEYAAGCGRTIDRALIIATLHNQATVYQRIWELTRSADYIEAIIYNVSAFLSSEEKFQFTSEVKDIKSHQHAKLSTSLGNKLSLIIYLLQFCAVSSQIKKHGNALSSAQKALSYLKIYCEELSFYEKMVGGPACSNFQASLLPELQNIREFQSEDASLQNSIDMLITKAHKSIMMFQKKLECTPAGISKLQLKQLEMFSLGQLMQVSPLPLKKIQERLDLQLELTLVKKIYKAIYISITHFTMATQLRLIANQRYGIDSSFKTQSKEYKQSQIHHLVAVITVALYVPCYTKYFEHILKSFMNHYQIDLTQAPSFSEDSDHQAGDIMHLQIQSISQKDSLLSQPNNNNQSSNRHPLNSKSTTARKTDKSSLLAQHDKTCNRTTMHEYASGSSSESSNLKTMNRTALADKTQKSNKKGSKHHKSKKKSEHTQREKQIYIIEKVTSSKSRSKAKKDSSFHRSKSGKKVQEEEQEEKVVHYFQYDNYSTKKLVNKKGKDPKAVREISDLLKKGGKGIKDAKSPEALINNHLRKLKAISQSTKDLKVAQVRTLKKCKSPQLNTSRSPNVQLKKHK